MFKLLRTWALILVLARSNIHFYHFHQRVSEIAQQPWHCLANNRSISYHITNSTQISTPPSLTNIARHPHFHSTWTTHASTYSTPFLKFLLKCAFVCEKNIWMFSRSFSLLADFLDVQYSFFYETFLFD